MYSSVSLNHKFLDNKITTISSHFDNPVIKCIWYYSEEVSFALSVDSKIDMPCLFVFDSSHDTEIWIVTD